MSSLHNTSYGLCGRNIVFSGVEVAQKLQPYIQEAGGCVLTTVDITTDILVVKSMTTYETCKLKEAKLIGVPIIMTFEQFVRHYLPVLAEKYHMDDYCSTTHLKNPEPTPAPKFYSLPAGFTSHKLKKIKQKLGVILRHGDCVEFSQTASYDAYFIAADPQNRRRKTLLKSDITLLRGATPVITIPKQITSHFDDALNAYKEFRADSMHLYKIDIAETDRFIRKLFDSASVLKTALFSFINIENRWKLYVDYGHGVTKDFDVDTVTRKMIESWDGLHEQVISVGNKTKPPKRTLCTIS